MDTNVQLLIYVSGIDSNNAKVHLCSRVANVKSFKTKMTKQNETYKFSLYCSSDTRTSNRNHHVIDCHRM